MPDNKKEANVVAQLQTDDRVLKAIRDVLPKVMNADRFLSMAVAAAKVQAMSKYVVNKTSILLSVYKAAKLGLELNEQLGHAYLVPFKGECTLIPGYKGLLELIRRSGQIADVHAFIVYEKDEFDFWEDENGQHIKYRPTHKSDRGEPIWGVSVARFKDKDTLPSIDVMPYHYIDGIRRSAVSRTPKSPWANKLHVDAMARKTMIRHHSKTLPVTPEVADAVALDERVENDNIERVMDEDIPEFMKDAQDAEFEDVHDEVEPKPKSTRRRKKKADPEPEKEQQQEEPPADDAPTQTPPEEPTISPKQRFNNAMLTATTSLGVDVTQEIMTALQSEYDTPVQKFADEHYIKAAEHLEDRVKEQKERDA